MFRMLGAGAAVIFIGVGTLMTGHDKSTNYTLVDAKVVGIERECGIIETETSFDGSKKVRNVRGSCIKVDGWKALKSQKHSERRKVDGTATMRVSYVSPADGSQQFASLNYTGRNTEFYDWSFGDQVELLAHNEEPGKIRKP